MKKTVTHLIVGLAKGGAETMLYQILKYRSNPEIEHRVISLGATRYYDDIIRELGYEVFDVKFRSNPVRAFWNICRLIKGTDSLCCWMYHANLLGYLAGRLMGVKKIIWTIHHSNLDPALNSAMTLRINRLCAHLSKNISEIMYTGEHARKIHEEIGYESAKGYVANNGCDCFDYAPDSEAAKSLREELGIPADKRIILSVTKNTPIKDVPTFLRAYATLRETIPDTTAVLCGREVEISGEGMQELCHQLGLVPGDDIHLLGLRDDVPRLLAACDLYVLHSAGEALPVTLLQAMSCGCLCITTDVGDSKRILALNDRVVEPGEPQLLEGKLREVLMLPEEQAAAERIGNRCRALEKFDIRKIVKEYEEKF